jgi:type I restriction enzyme S subunit
MSGLPSTWTQAKVGELVTLNPKNNASDDTLAGFVPMSRLGVDYRSPVAYEPRPWSDIKKGYTHFADGDVLLAKITPCFENGKAGLVSDLPNGLGAGSTEYFVNRPNDGVLDARYLLGIFKTELFLREGALQMTGSVGHKRVPKAYLLETEIPLAPFPEQKRIADKLDAVLARVDACRDRLDRIPAILKRFRQSVLAAATSGKLTTEWRAERVGWADEGSPTNEAEEPRWASQAQPNLRAARDSAQLHYDVTATPDSATLHPGYEASADLNRIKIERQQSSKKVKTPKEHLSAEEFPIPDSWVWASLDSLAGQIVDGTHHTPTYVGEGVPFVSVKDIRNGAIDFSNTKFISAAEHQELVKRCHPQKGDLLITKSGTIGRTAIVPTDKGFSLFVSVALIKPASRLVNMRFVELALLGWIGSIDVSSRIIGTAIKNLHLQDMRVLAIPFPSLREQTEIVRRVESLFAYADRLEARYTAARAQVGKLTPATLAKAFRGELVPQDPSDEPASVLLARIRAQRGEQVSVKSRGRQRPQ